MAVVVKISIAWIRVRARCRGHVTRWYFRKARGLRALTKEVITLARPNYGFEKRQREMAQQKKKDAKKQRKQGSSEVSPENPEKPANETKPA